jgi:ADP-ribose pyrophosphatase
MTETKEQQASQISTPVQVYKDEFFEIQQSEITENGKSFNRERIVRPEAVGVLLHNPETGCIVLAQQKRYAVFDLVAGELLEIPAGTIDREEDPVQAVVRECREETGYAVHPSALRLLSVCFPTPGYSSERVYLYYAEVKNSDKTGDGGGLDDDDENIRVVELAVPEFRNRISIGTIEDMKTQLAGFMAMQQELI